ncbi:MAG: Gfo/Idh/MocA family oxidoreductase [Candidatus Omnitrophica bacterium]|nr:Gfo/Idh/MocA family oxidoreductase [Candidatus Omnitrophota bacterium]
MTKIAVIGCGYWGKNLVRNLYELGVLDTVCDTNKTALSQALSLYPKIKTTADVGAVLRSQIIEAVAIATPAVTHYELTKKAILAGKDVFVEKPLALTVKEAQELIKLAEEKKKIIMVGHILQYHPAVLKLKELVAGGELGKIRYIYSNRLNIGKLRTEENILWSFAPHDISAILMLMEEEPVKVTAFAGDYLNPGINDVTLTTLEFKNGVKGHIFVSWLHPYKEQKLIVVGSKAMAVFDDVSKEKLFLYPHTIEWHNGKIPVARKADYQVVPIGQGEPLKLELEHFLECVNNRKSPRTSAEEGLKVLKILEKAENSLTAPGGKNPDKQPHIGVKIHPSACVDEGCAIKEGTQIWHYSHILKGSQIGKNCRIGQNVVIGPNAAVGNGCKIQNNISIYEGVTLEDNVFCGPSCVFTNVFNPRSEVPRMDEIRKTLVKTGASIGANATIVCGNTLGKYCFVGAGSVVTADVPDHALIYGNPAKVKGWMCECGIKLGFKGPKALCKACKREYRKTKNRVERSK